MVWFVVHYFLVYIFQHFECYNSVTFYIKILVKPVCTITD